MGGYTLEGCLPGFETNWKYGTIDRGLGEAAENEEGKCGTCPDFELCTLALALQLGKYHGKSSVRASERRSADQRRTRL